MNAGLVPLVLSLATAWLALSLYLVNAARRARERASIVARTITEVPQSRVERDAARGTGAAARGARVGHRSPHAVARGDGAAREVTGHRDLRAVSHHVSRPGVVRRTGFGLARAPRELAAHCGAAAPRLPGLLRHRAFARAGGQRPRLGGGGRRRGDPRPHSRHEGCRNPDHRDQEPPVLAVAYRHLRRSVPDSDRPPPAAAAAPSRKLPCGTGA